MFNICNGVDNKTFLLEYIGMNFNIAGESGLDLFNGFQKIIGEIETIGGVLTGDPNTQAEGEFNVEVGDIREDLENAEEEERKALVFL